MEKTAVVIKRGKTAWLLGGHWTAGERFPKRPGNLKKLAQEEGFAPANTAAAWLAEEQQVGWFVFSGKPAKGVPLAPIAARRVPAGQWPWQGLFCLGDDLWWLVVTDSAGALHPAWDIAGTKDDIMQVMSDRIAELAPIPHQLRLETPEESWEWLLGDASIVRSVPSAVGVTSAQQAAKKGVLVVVPLIVLLGGSGAGLILWKKHQAQLAQQAAQAALLAQQQSQSAQAAAAAAQEAAQIAHIQAQWAATPRPWAQMQSWQTVLSACQPGPLTQDGWRLTGLQCTVQGNSLAVQRVWSRGQFATVLNAPSGQTDPAGQTVTQTSTVALPAAQTGQAANDAQKTATWWLGMTQQWAGVLQIKAEPLTPYYPPYPPNTPPQIQQRVKPPLLWRQGKVTLSSAVEPKPAWPVLDGVPGFVPEKMTIDLQGNHVQWTLEGTQYVNP